MSLINISANVRSLLHGSQTQVLSATLLSCTTELPHLHMKVACKVTKDDRLRKITSKPALTPPFPQRITQYIKFR